MDSFDHGFYVLAFSQECMDVISLVFISGKVSVQRINEYQVEFSFHGSKFFMEFPCIKGVVQILRTIGNVEILQYLVLVIKGVSVGEQPCIYTAWYTALSLSTEVGYRSLPCLHAMPLCACDDTEHHIYRYERLAASGWAEYHACPFSLWNITLY